MPVKAEYSHEAASLPFMVRESNGTYLGLGTPVGLEHYLDVCRPIRPLHRASFVIVHRLLRSYLCARPWITSGGEKISQVTLLHCLRHPAAELTWSTKAKRPCTMSAPDADRFTNKNWDASWKRPANRLALSIFITKLPRGHPSTLLAPSVVSACTCVWCPLLRYGCVDALYVACRSDVVRSVAQPRVRCQSRRACRSTRENLRDVDAYEGDVGRRPRGPSHCCNLSSLMDGTICITL